MKTSTKMNTIFICAHLGEVNVSYLCYRNSCFAWNGDMKKQAKISLYYVRVVGQCSVCNTGPFVVPFILQYEDSFNGPDKW